MRQRDIDGVGGVAVAAAVGEGIGGDVEDAHDERALAEGERTTVRERDGE